MALTKPNESILNITSTGLKIDNVQDNVDTVQDNLNTAEADLYTEVENKILGSHITGLGISNNSIDSAHDIDIAPGFCKDDTFNNLIELSTGLIKRLDEPWEEGTSTGGLDTSTGIVADTWYYLWAIKRDSDGLVDVLFSASATNPSMPSGWGSKRRIRGAVLTDVSGNIIGFNQKDNYFWYNSKILDLSSTSHNLGNRVLVTMSVPPNFIGLIRGHLINTATTYMLFGNPNELDTTVTLNNADLIIGTSSTINDTHKHVLVDSSSQMFYRTNVSSTSNPMIFQSLGFIDNADI